MARGDVRLPAHAHAPKNENHATNGVVDDLFTSLNCTFLLTRGLTARVGSFAIREVSCFLYPIYLFVRWPLGSVVGLRGGYAQVSYDLFSANPLKHPSQCILASEQGCPVFLMSWLHFSAEAHAGFAVPLLPPL